MTQGARWKLASPLNIGIWLGVGGAAEPLGIIDQSARVLITAVAVLTFGTIALIRGIYDLAKLAGSNKQ